MSKFRLHDWNDAKLLIACAEGGGFAGAAKALGVDQTTVSRRIGILEAAVGRPLFQRRRSGATPTAAGEALLERARALEEAARGFEQAMHGLVSMPAPTVTIAASEGVLTYVIIPALLGSPAAETPLDRALLRSAVPHLAFTAPGNRADIAVVATNPGDLPEVHGAIRVRKVGTMTFLPVAGQSFVQSQAFMQSRPRLDQFDDLRTQPLLDNLTYRGIRAFDEWHGLLSALETGPVLVAANTAAVQKPLLAGAGITILPPYARLYDSRVVVLDVPAPRFAVDLWLVAHEDSLREPAVRELYDTLAAMFLKSRWFRA